MSTSIKERFLSNYVRVSEYYSSFFRIVRFVVSGGIATSVNLASLFVLTQYIGVWYLYSSIIAFGIAFGVSFVLQKIWTFQDRSSKHIQLQAVLFLIIILAGLMLNTAMLYVLVEFLKVHYIAGQLVSGVFIAVCNFFGYKHIVFTKRGDTLLSHEQQS